MLYLHRLFLSFLSFVFVWVALVYFQIGGFTQTSKWVYEAYELKESSARKINTKKVAIVSGSNSLFGFNSGKLESHWNMPVINDAVHALLGLPYILYKSKKILNKGDIVILPLEYFFYQADGKPSELYSDYILSRDGVYFKNLSLVDQLVVISNLSIKRVYQGIKFYFNATLKPTKGVYGVQNINEHGDQINIEPDKMTEREFSDLRTLSAEEISSSDISYSFIHSMDAYVNWAKDNGICIIAMPPNYMFFQKYKEEKYISFLSNIKRYYASRDVKFLGNPLTYMYEKNYYFNTNYHLNSDGVQKRTLQVMDDIGEDISIHCNSI